MPSRVRQFIFTLSGAAMLTALGCRDLTPPAGITGSKAARNLSGIHSDERSEAEVQATNPHLLACQAHGSVTASAIVGPTGATIAVGRDRLVVPAGAVAESTLITATIPADTLADIHFEPQGLQFAKRATLVLNTAGCNIGNEPPSHVVYLDNDGNVLETLDATFNGRAQAVATTISHFSSYSIAF